MSRPPSSGSPDPASPDPAPGSEDAPRSATTSGLGAALQREEFSVAQALGGPRGVAESVIPTLVFMVTFVITDDVLVSAIAAVAVVVVALIARLAARQSPATVLGGLIGVGLGAVLAIRSGQGTDFYAPGIVINAVSLLVLVVSLLARRPLVGLIVALLDPSVQDWKERPAARRAYTRATLLFVVLYALRLLVQVPLLLSGQVAALGVARLALGLPAFAVVGYLVWLMHRSVVASAKTAPASD